MANYTFKYSAETPYGTITRKSPRNYTHVAAIIFPDAQPGQQIGEVSFAGNATLATKKAGAMNRDATGQKKSWEAMVFPLNRQ